MSLIKTDNNYTLPDGNVLINFSGGRTSGMMLHHILEANGGLPDRVQVIFANTGREMPETLDFVAECGERWGIDIKWIEYRPDLTESPHRHSYVLVDRESASVDGEPFRAALERKHWMLPNAVGRSCTKDLKLDPVRKHLSHDMGWKAWARTLGIRADEPSRIKPSRWKTRPNWYPLADAGLTVRDVNEFWRAQPFDLRLPTNNGTTWLGNCDGCFLKSEAKRARLAREYPKRFEWWVNIERLATEKRGRKGGRDMTFRDGQPYSQLGKYVQRQGDWIFDTEDALCQRDGGECTDI